MPFDSEVVLRENRRLTPQGYVARFLSPRLAAEVRPGQFVMLGFGGRTEPLLRRPYSIYRVGRPGSPADTCEIQYKVVGEGTARLAAMAAGERLACLGPLGTGFSPPPPGREPLLVAGGIGIAGLLHLAAALVADGRRPPLLFGCRSSEDVPLAEGFEALGLPVEVATEDGTAGRRGLVTAILEERLSGPPVEIYACGPQPMLAAVARQAAGRAGCQVSVESHMACGFGVCLGCVVETASGEGYGRYVRACMEGPVFRGEELRW